MSLKFLQNIFRFFQRKNVKKTFNIFYVFLGAKTLIYMQWKCLKYDNWFDWALEIPHGHLHGITLAWCMAMQPCNLLVEPKLNPNNVICLYCVMLWMLSQRYYYIHSMFIHELSPTEIPGLENDFKAQLPPNTVYWSSDLWFLVTNAS